MSYLEDTREEALSSTRDLGFEEIEPASILKDDAILWVCSGVTSITWATAIYRARFDGDSPPKENGVFFRLRSNCVGRAYLGAIRGATIVSTKESSEGRRIVSRDIQKGDLITWCSRPDGLHRWVQVSYCAAYDGQTMPRSGVQYLVERDSKELS